MRVYNDEQLHHYGVKGMKWGIRKGESYTTVKKGSELTRISLRANEPIDSNRKYVSTNEKDQKFWEKRLVKPYKDMGYDKVYKYQYQTIKELKTSTTLENGIQFTNKLLEDPEFGHQVIKGNSDYIRRSGMKETDFTTDFFRSLGWGSNAANEYMQYMQNKGYDAIADIFGKSSGAKDPLILLNPNDSIKLNRISEL